MIGIFRIYKNIYRNSNHLQFIQIEKLYSNDVSVYNYYHKLQVEIRYKGLKGKKFMLSCMFLSSYF